MSMHDDDPDRWDHLVDDRPDPERSLFWDSKSGVRNFHHVLVDGERGMVGYVHERLGRSWPHKSGVEGVGVVSLFGNQSNREAVVVWDYSPNQEGRMSPVSLAEAQAYAENFYLENRLWIESWDRGAR